jgi:hypothetical protein
MPGEGDRVGAAPVKDCDHLEPRFQPRGHRWMLTRAGVEIIARMVLRVACAQYTHTKQPGKPNQLSSAS